VDAFGQSISASFPNKVGSLEELKADVAAERAYSSRFKHPRSIALAAGLRQCGLAYRNYVEQSATLGFIVGIEWFTLVNQATTGRWFSKYNGESYNTGLVSVADRPWKDMLAEVVETNHGIYNLLLGKRAPFAWDDARFKTGKTR
jgi:hypothetical protein